MKRESTACLPHHANSPPLSLPASVSASAKPWGYTKASPQVFSNSKYQYTLTSSSLTHVHLCGFTLLATISGFSSFIVMINVFSLPLCPRF